MPVEAEQLCDVWEEEPVAPCTPSKLYRLGPVGIGTPMVESFTSYISRLANAHSVLLRTLVTNEILPNINRTHLYQKGQPVYDQLTTFWKRSAMLNGTCSTASNWVHIIEQLTQRNDLRFLTMLTFANVLSGRELVRQKQVWCPLCYEEWRKTGQVVYQPLLWQLSVMNLCPKHHIPLVLRCPYQDCGLTLSPLAPRFQPGYCSHCNRWLGKSYLSEGCQQTNGDEQEWQFWLEQPVGELLAAAPELPSVPCLQLISSFISKHVRETIGGNLSEFARRVQYHRRTVWEWTQGLQVPQLDALLHICSYFETTPLYLLAGNAKEIAQCKKEISVEKLARASLNNHVRRFDSEKLRNALEQVLQSNEEPPPSMREVARRLNYDQSHLRKHFPDLCQAISARYLAYQQEQRLSRLRSMNAQVRKTVEILHKQGCSLSERQIGKMIGKRGIFKEGEARASLKSLLYVPR